MSNLHPWFGLVEKIPPLAGFPDGKVRIRLRQSEFARVRVLLADGSGITEYYPAEVDGVWIPAFEGGQNRTLKSCTKE